MSSADNFANSLDPDQARKTLDDIPESIFFKLKLILNKIGRQKIMINYLADKEFLNS